MTRLEMARLLASESDKSVPSACVFPDILEGDKGAVGYLVEIGVLKGLPDGTFAPMLPVTRGEAATALMRLTKVPK